MADVLMVCSTPFQLFNAIHIRETVLSMQKVDMYVLNISSTAEQLYMNIRNKSIFEHVFLVDVGITDYKYKYLYYLNRLTKLINGRKLLKENFQYYKEVWIVGTEVFSKIIYYELYKKNQKVKLFFYEEGIGTYINILTESHDKFRHQILNFLYGFDLFLKCEKCYVYQPKLVKSIWNNIEICSIPRIDRREKTSLFYVFDCEENNLNKDYFKKKKIFLTSNDPRYDREQKEIIDAMANTDVLLKMHPNQVDKYDNCKLTKMNGSGIEFINLFHELSDCILISFLSTGCLTPKMIFGEEPRIIMLYKLLPDYKKIQPYFQEILLQIKDLYEDKSKIIVPESEKEFLDLIGKTSTYENEKV